MLTIDNDLEWFVVIISSQCQRLRMICCSNHCMIMLLFVWQLTAPTRQLWQFDGESFWQKLYSSDKLCTRSLWQTLYAVIVTNCTRSLWQNIFYWESWQCVIMTEANCSLQETDSICCFFLKLTICHFDRNSSTEWTKKTKSEYYCCNFVFFQANSHKVSNIVSITLWELVGNGQSYCTNTQAYFFGPPCIAEEPEVDNVKLAVCHFDRNSCTGWTEKLSPNIISLRLQWYLGFVFLVRRWQCDC